MKGRRKRTRRTRRADRGQGTSTKSTEDIHDLALIVDTMTRNTGSTTVEKGTQPETYHRNKNQDLANRLLRREEL